MLSIVNPVNMAMNMPCCAYAPYCVHTQRQLPPQLPASVPLGLGPGQENNTSWSHRSSTPQHVHYDFNRLPQPSSLSRPGPNYAEEGNKFPPSLNSFSSARHGASWSGPSNPALNHDYGNSSWLPHRSRGSFQGSMSSSFSHGPYDYLSEMKLDPFELKEGSPSRTTEFSTVSMSTESSPAPIAPLASYESMPLNEEGDSYLRSQPLAPEQLTASGGERHTHSLSPAFGSQTLSKPVRSRRKHSEAIHCEICHKSFDRRSNFKSHWETHDKDRQRTVCKMDGCNKTFGRPAEMTRHVNSAHRQKLFPCPSCGKEFTRHDILLRHCKDACPVLVKGKSPSKKSREKHSP